MVACYYDIRRLLHSEIQSFFLSDFIMLVLGAQSCLTLWPYVAHQAPLSVGFFRQEYLIGLPFPPPGDLPDPGIEPVSPALAGGFFTTKP